MACDNRDSPQQLADRMEKMASFPEVAFRVDEVLSDDRSSSADIGAVIEPDPALSAALLKIANSAAYGSLAAVDDIETAIRVVGSCEIRDLAYAVSATRVFNGIPNELISVESFWRHSLYVAVAAECLATEARMCRGISMFTAGLLHDIGQLVMFNQCPDLSRESIRLSLSIDDGRATCQAETEIFGFDHTAVGAELARKWHFPETLTAAIAHHHAPHQSGEHIDVALIVNVANSIGILAELRSEDFDDAPEIDPAAKEKLGLHDEVLLNVVESSHETVNDLIRLFVH